MFFACGSEISCHQYSFASRAPHMLCSFSHYTRTSFSIGGRATLSLCYFSPVAKVLSAIADGKVSAWTIAAHCVAAAECERASVCVCVCVRWNLQLSFRSKSDARASVCGNADLIYFFRRIKRQYFADGSEWQKILCRRQKPNAKGATQRHVK